MRPSYVFILGLLLTAGFQLAAAPSNEGSLDLSSESMSESLSESLPVARVSRHRGQSLTEERQKVLRLIDGLLNDGDRKPSHAADKVVELSVDGVTK